MSKRMLASEMEALIKKQNDMLNDLNKSLNLANEQLSDSTKIISTMSNAQQGLAVEVSRLKRENEILKERQNGMFSKSELLAFVVAKNAEDVVLLKDSGVFDG